MGFTLPSTPQSSKLSDSTYATAAGHLDSKALEGVSVLCPFLQFTESLIFMQFKLAVLS